MDRDKVLMAVAIGGVIVAVFGLCVVYIVTRDPLNVVVAVVVAVVQVSALLMVDYFRGRR